jgi:beta-glucosidase
MTVEHGLLFPGDFLWGTATAAYQVEGAVAEDGRGPSVWDTFSHRPGTTFEGATGDVACDHYHRWREDVALMTGLGAGAYRFSVAWPRVQPDGRGAVNPAGLDFYDRLVDALHEAGIAACPTLFHWDLPQPLEDDGGWMLRDTAARFADYAGLVAERLADRVTHWFTLNEPFVHAVFGYGFGVHAPGRTLMLDCFPAMHHQLLAHGLAARSLRAAGAASIGIVHNLAPAQPLTDTAGDRLAAEIIDTLHNRTFCDPVLLGRYPDLPPGGPAVDRSCVRDGDLELVAAPIDVLGVNYYAPDVVKAAGEGNPLGFELTDLPGAQHTAMGWPVVPDGLRRLLVGLRDRYGDALPPVLVTENGAAYDDHVGPDGSVDDQDRIAYLDAHLRAVRAAMDAGVDVRGYFVWSLLDNFEWADGYAKRFGLVHVDYATQRRTPKASYGWLRDLLRAQRT